MYGQSSCCIYHTCEDCLAVGAGTYYVFNDKLHVDHRTQCLVPQRFSIRQPCSS